MIKVRTNKTVSDIEYSPNLSTRSFIQDFLSLPKAQVSSVSETVTSSTLEFSETKDKATITKITSETVVTLVGQKVVSVEVHTKKEQVTLGVDKTSLGTMFLEYEILEQVKVENSSKSTSINKVSAGLKDKVGKVQEYNKDAIKSNIEAIEQTIQNNDLDNLNSNPEPTETPSPKKKRK